MTTLPPTPDAAVTLAKIELKVDQLLEKAGDHEKRLRSLEFRSDPAQQVRRAAVSLWVSALAAAAAAGSLLVTLAR